MARTGRCDAQRRRRTDAFSLPVLGALLLPILATLALPPAAEGIYLDAARNFSLRARLYSEASVATESSELQTLTHINRGDVVSHRSFFNPELDASLTQGLSFLGLDEIKFRLALWGFYDGIYDYLDPKWRNTAKNVRARFTRGHTKSAPFIPHGDTRIFGPSNPPRKVYSYQPDPTLGHDGGPGEAAEVPFRINEAYLNLTKGRYSVRIGRQTISWGEADTIALLDQTNPFDVTRAVPGVFEDIDEARIPLWTLRTQVQLFDQWKWFSSAFVDAYLVPGSIDTATTYTPIPAGVSPYSPPESDPQAIVDDLTGNLPPAIANLLNNQLGGIAFRQYDRRVSRNMANSRWGVRLESIINRDYTASVWFYRTLSQIPVPHFLPLDLAGTSIGNPSLPPGSGPLWLITETSHDLVNVAGASLSFYNQWLNGIVRLNAQYFNNEPAFIPNKNLPFENLLRNPALGPLLQGGGAVIEPGLDQGTVPKADFLRWEVGYDRFFFNRVLNPANSFVWVTGLVGSWNVDETFTGRDYRFYGQRKLNDDCSRKEFNQNLCDPWKLGANFDVLTPAPGEPPLSGLSKLKTQKQDFVDLKPLEWFVQSTLQTDYFHGKLTPRLTTIINPRGTYVVTPSILFRYSDRLLFSVKYAALMGGFFQTGFFRDRDQVAFRLTYLLN